MKKIFLSLLFLMSALLLLPGCDPRSWFSHSCDSCSSGHAHDHSADSSPCCVSLDGKPVLTQRDFEHRFNQLSMARPDIQQALSGLPLHERQNFYIKFAEDVMLAGLLVSRYAKETGLLDTPEYKTAAQEAHEAVETQLMNSALHSHLLKKIEQEITDEIAQKYYEEHRELAPMFKHAPFIDTMGGVRVKVIEGLNEAEAKTISAQAHKEDFSKVAKRAGRSVKDLGLITPRSMQIDAQIRTKVIGYTQVPQIDVVQMSTGKYAVINAVYIQKNTFKPFTDPEVKKSVKTFLIHQELGKAVTQIMNELKEKYNAVIHRDTIIDLIKSDASEKPLVRKDLTA